MTPREREIRERLEKATPGPWKQDSYLSGTEYIRFQDAPSENQYGRGSLGCHISYYNIATFDMTESECEKRKWADANFIAHAPSDITYLLAQLTTAREIIERAKWTLNEVQKHCLCERNTKGFDYHEKHTKLGKPEVGTRWLTPEVLCKDALARITEMEK